MRRSRDGTRRSAESVAVNRFIPNKTIIGRRLHARTLPNQKTEARIGCAVLNRMTSLGMPSRFVSNRLRTKGAGARLHFFMHQRRRAPPVFLRGPGFDGADRGG